MSLQNHPQLFLKDCGDQQFLRTGREQISLQSSRMAKGEGGSVELQPHLNLWEGDGANPHGSYFQIY